LARRKGVNELGKGKPFLEVLSSAIHEDYRFPFLELFAFLYAAGTFVLANFTVSVYSQATTNEAIAYTVTTSLISGSLIVFILLILKNVAYGLGSDLEKGIIQSYFSYPLRRRGILTAKLLSAIGFSLLLFLGIQISALYILAPDIVLPQFSTIILTYAANLSYPLFISAIMLLMTLKLRRGGIGLVVGIVLYFAMSIVSSIAFFVAAATESALGLQIISVIAPTYALQYYYGGLAGVAEFSSVSWTPTLSETMLYVGGSYVIVASLFVIGYVYFSRRLNL
jgi:ABC-type transport system involved in multi-copper enzyme maturation permease subunit